MNDSLILLGKKWFVNRIHCIHCIIILTNEMNVKHSCPAQILVFATVIPANTRRWRNVGPSSKTVGQH